MTKEIQFRIIRAVAYWGDTGWNYREISDPYHTLYFIVSGDGHIRTEQGITDLLPGHAYLIPRKLSHDLWCDSHIQKTYIDFHVELFPGYDVLTKADRVLSFPAGETVCREMYAAAARDDLRAQTWLRGQLMTAVSQFMPEGTPDIPAQMIPFLPIIEEIQQNLSANIRRKDLALRYNWNPSSFSRAFHRAFGCGFKQYVEHLLLDRLVEEMLTTNKTLHTIADEYDFCDAYYLSAFFKRSMGMSPAAYRRLREP